MITTLILVAAVLVALGLEIFVLEALGFSLALALIAVLAVSTLADIGYGAGILITAVFWIITLPLVRIVLRALPGNAPPPDPNILPRDMPGTEG